MKIKLLVLALLAIALVSVPGSARQQEAKTIVESDILKQYKDSRTDAEQMWKQVIILRPTKSQNTLDDAEANLKAMKLLLNARLKYTEMVKSHHNLLTKVLDAENALLEQGTTPRPQLSATEFALNARALSFDLAFYYVENANPAYLKNSLKAREVWLNMDTEATKE